MIDHVAVYLFTFHAYRSWLPNRPQGYVRRGVGILPPDPKMRAHYDRDAKHRPVQFDRTMQETMVQATFQICEQKHWRLHQVRATPTHLHALVSWRGFIEWKQVSNTLKRRLGAALSKAINCAGPWFSRGSSRKQVRDRGHFDYLMDEYLPKHGGFCRDEHS